MQVNQFTGLDISKIIASPLLAVVNANQEMANQQIHLILTHCFSTENDVLEPVMVKLAINSNYVQPESEVAQELIEQVSAVIQVPLITLIPISNLAVQEFQADFGIEISHIQSSDDEKTLLQGHISPGESATDPQNKNSPPTSKEQLSVNMKIGELPLSVGLTSLLTAYSKAIHPTDVE